MPLAIFNVTKAAEEGAEIALEIDPRVVASSNA